MRSTVLLIFNLFFLFSDGYDILNPETRPLLSFLLGKTPPSPCLVQCLETLKRPLIAFVNDELTLKTKDKICLANEQAHKCVHNNTACSKSDRRVLEKLSSGISWACGAHGTEPFKYINPCIVTLGKELRRQHSCKTECNAAIDSNKVFVPSVPNLLGKLEPMCGPLACFLNCTAKQINMYCPTGGSRLINVVIGAFDELVREFKLATRKEKMLIIEKVPKKCELYFSEREMMALRFDKQFVNDMFFMISSWKQRSSKLAKSEAERILDGLLEEKGKEINLPEPLVWDFRAIAICAAIIVVMVLNVAGLIFTIWWCVTSKEDQKEHGGGTDACMNQFVEPNIRMKLKLPKIRADAIHDSSQEVFELRVPRNGNQFHLNDEQTVVVPRYKRRRTYSVPLEPRPRTQSTGSDHFPHVVIVRNQEH